MSSAQINIQEKWKKEIADTEKAFATMAQEKGLSFAFLHFAAEDAVLNRNDSLLMGKTAIANWFEQQPMTPGATLTWSPDYIDVSSSGDLGYTYGRYLFGMTGPDGQKVQRRGVFHTVWKRQTDGSWKYVWD